MAVLSNKSSSSPISGRARNSEIGNPMRRSFSGNPFSKPSIIPNPRGLNPNTPANTPTENSRRSSVSGDIDDKENSKSAAKIRSPMSGSKETKHFMSPTISAAFKFTPSPRKRILEERNETVRDSGLFAELKIPSFGESLPDSDHKKEEEKEESCVSSKAEPIVEAEPQAINVDPTFKISPRSDRFIAPLDSDPSAPPYDPKTNYLSPRPQFLHYKPNPRIELYLNKGQEGKCLEDSFLSGSFSDTEEETTKSDDSLKESEEDDLSEKKEDELVVSEPNLIVSLLSPEEETMEAKSVSKRRSVWRSKLMALLIVLSVVCVSISVANMAVIDHSVFDGSPNFFKDYDESKMLAFGKAGLDELGQKLGVWYENSVTFLSDLVSYLRGVHDNIESLHYYNLTDLFEDVRIDGYDVNVFVMPIRGQEMDIADEYEEKQVGQEAETSFDVEEQEITSPVSEQVFGVPKSEHVESENGLSSGDFEADPALVSEEVSEAPTSELVEPENGRSAGDFEADPAPISQADEAQLQNEVSEVVDMSFSSVEVESANEADFGSEPPTFDDSSNEDAKASQEVDFAADETEDDFSKLKVLGMALLVVLAAFGSAVFVAAKKGNNGQTLDAKSSVISKKLDISPEKNNLEVKQHSSWSFSGDYCPSEMSSYEINTPSHHNKGVTKNGLNNEEAHSQKKKGQRRESMASSSMDSSMGSPSYGSFTTYEKIPTKNTYGDDEIVTPVRRSSRLRGQVTSPS